MNHHRHVAIALVLAMTLSTLVVLLNQAPSVAGQSQGDVADVHLNLKEPKDPGGLSPETVGNPETEATREKPPRSWSESGTIVVVRTKAWTNVADWMGSEAQYDVSLSGPVKFNIWWIEDDNDNWGEGAQLEFDWELNVNGDSIAHYKDDTTHDCDPAGGVCEWSATTNQLNITNLIKGDAIDLTIMYRSFRDIFIYFDNATYDSGVTLKANSIVPLKGSAGGSVTFEFAEAWDTRIDEGLDGNFINLMVGGVAVNNDLAETSEGGDYEVNNATVTAQKITWSTGGANPTISFSYTKNASTYASAQMIDVKSLGGGGGGDDDDSPGLGFGGFLVAFSLAFALGRRDRGKKES